MTSVLVRFSGLAAIVGGVLGIVLTPILTYLWAVNSDVYGYFGRTYFPVYLGCLLGLAGLYALRSKGVGPPDPSKPDTERWMYGLILVGLVASLIGDIFEYWGGTPGDAFTRAQIKGFTLEVLGLLMVLCGSVVLGVVYRQAQFVPKIVPWLLIAAGPAGLILSVPHMPSDTMLLFCCAWVVLGYLLLTGKVVSAQQRVRVTG